MSLARVKTWVAGDTLTAADLNAEFNNLLNNPISLISPTTGVINFDNKLHTNLPVAALSGTSGSSGQIATISNSTGGVVWAAAAGVSNPTIILDAGSAVFTTALFPALVRSTHLQSSNDGVTMALAYDPSTMEKAYFTFPLSTMVSAVSSASIDLWITATSSGNTVWQVGTVFMLAGSSGGGASTATSTATAVNLASLATKISIGLVATSWATPGIVQCYIGRLSSDAGDASTGDTYLHTAALRITV